MVINSSTSFRSKLFSPGAFLFLFAQSEQNIAFSMGAREEKSAGLPRLEIITASSSKLISRKIAAAEVLLARLEPW
jgi:hypothetical protein